MKIRIALIILSFTLLFVFCSKENNPIGYQDNEIFDEYLQIQTEKSVYSIRNDFHNSNAHVSGTITNTTQDTFYANLGDAYNSSIDQDNLLFAYKTDGYFEYNIHGTNWENVEQGVLIERSKVIRLLPETHYTIQAMAVIDTDKTGKHRLRIHYYRRNSETEVDTLQDISNTFTIEK